MILLIVLSICDDRLDGINYSLKNEFKSAKCIEIVETKEKVLKKIRCEGKWNYDPTRCCNKKKKKKQQKIDLWENKRFKNHPISGDSKGGIYSPVTFFP